MTGPPLRPLLELRHTMYIIAYVGHEFVCFYNFFAPAFSDSPNLVRRVQNIILLMGPVVTQFLHSM